MAVSRETTRAVLVAASAGLPASEALRAGAAFDRERGGTSAANLDRVADDLAIGAASPADVEALHFDPPIAGAILARAGAGLTRAAMLAAAGVPPSRGSAASRLLVALADPLSVGAFAGAAVALGVTGVLATFVSPVLQRIAHDTSQALQPPSELGLAGGLASFALALALLGLVLRVREARPRHLDLAAAGLEAGLPITAVMSKLGARAATVRAEGGSPRGSGGAAGPDEARRVVAAWLGGQGPLARLALVELDGDSAAAAVARLARLERLGPPGFDAALAASGAAAILVVAASALTLTSVYGAITSLGSVIP